MSKIYRFMSFETFVDVVIRKSLAFVHPSLWDDPYEFGLFESNFKNILNASDGKLNEETIGAIMEHIITFKTFCQSWTKLSESDALWRIYGHNNTSIRISTDTSKIDELDDIKIMDVEYVEDFSERAKEVNEFYDMISLKRKAFEHEEEVRLINHMKYTDTSDANSYITDFIRLSGEPKFFEHVTLEEIPQEIDRIITRLNYGLKHKVKYIEYAHINKFVESVLVNPFAPDWFVDTVKIFCEINDIQFAGKSALYNKNV